MPPVRMLFVIGSLGGGGAERCMVDLLKRMDRKRFAPMLYLAYRSGELLAEVPADVPVFAHVDRPREETLPQKLAGKFRLLSEARAWHLSRICRQQRVELVFSWGVRLAYETALAARFAPVPRIAYCVAEPAVELETDFTTRTPWRHRLARWAYASSDRVYANSRGVVRQLVELYGLPESQIELFLNLRDFSRLDQPTENVNWPADGARIATVGRLHPQKGQAVLLDALAELNRRGRRVQLAIVGQGPQEAALRAQVERLGLQDRVVFTGFLSNPAAYYHQADLFVIPSLTEGLPNVLIEALICGLPSIAADCPTGPREILEDGKWGTLVPPGDVAALANALATALDRLPEERLRAQAASRALREKYDIELGLPALEQRFLDVALTSPARRVPA